MKFRLLLIFLLARPIFCSTPDPEAEEKEFIEQAIEKTNIFGLSSFELKANVRIDSNGKPLDGSYLLLWNGPEQWREEINFPGYTEVRIGAGGAVLLKRSTDFIPLRIHQLHAALGYGSGAEADSWVRAAPRHYERIQKIRERSERSKKLRCAEVFDGKKLAREVCVDEASGTLIRQQPFEDKDMTQVGTKVFPTSLSYVEKGKPLAEVRITELKATQKLPVSAFVPPKGATSQPGCMNPMPPHLVQKVTPRYPELEKQLRLMGTVAVDTVVGKDGIPRTLWLVSSAREGFNKVSLEAIQQWRYEPATCNGIAVEVETVLTVHFNLSGG